MVQTPLKILKSPLPSLPPKLHNNPNNRRHPNPLKNNPIHLHNNGWTLNNNLYHSDPTNRTNTTLLHRTMHILLLHALR